MLWALAADGSWVRRERRRDDHAGQAQLRPLLFCCAILWAVAAGAQSSEQDGCGGSAVLEPATLDAAGVAPSISLTRLARSALGGAPNSSTMRRHGFGIGERIAALGFTGIVHETGRLEATCWIAPGGDRRVENYAERLRFTPATRNGRPLAVTINGAVYAEDDNRGEFRGRLILNHIDTLQDRATKVSPQMIGRLERVPASVAGVVAVVLVDVTGEPLRAWAVSPEYDPARNISAPEVTPNLQRGLDRLFEELKSRCYIPDSQDGEPAVMPFTYTTH